VSNNNTTWAPLPTEAPVFPSSSRVGRPLFDSPQPLADVRQWIRRRLEQRAFPAHRSRPLPSYAHLMRSQWVPAFEAGCRRRMVLGAFRYGLLSENKGITWRNVTHNIRARLDLFTRHGDGEILMDVANLCMLLWHFNDHPSRCFGAISSDDTPHYRKVETHP